MHISVYFILELMLLSWLPLLQLLQSLSCNLSAIVFIDKEAYDGKKLKGVS